MSDVRLIFSVQAVRAFLYGFSSILIGASLAATGLDAAAVGAVFTAMLLGMAISALAVGRWGEHLGRRRTYTGLLLLMGVAGTVFALTGSIPLLVLAALTGTLSTDPNESGPITSVEQAMLSSTPASERARVYGRYNAVAYLAGAVGALAAGGPTALRAILPGLPPDQRWLLLMPIGAVVCVVLATAAIDDRRGRAHSAAGRPRPAALARHGPAAFGPLRAGRVRRRLHRADLHGLLVRPPVWRDRRGHGPRLLRGGAAPGGFVRPRRMAREPHRPAEHHGLHPPSVQRAPGACPVRAELRRGGPAAHGPLGAVADGRARPAGLPGCAGRSGRADGGRGVHECRATRGAARGSGAGIGVDGNGGRDPVPGGRRS